MEFIPGAYHLRGHYAGMCNAKKLNHLTIFGLPDGLCSYSISVIDGGNLFTCHLSSFSQPSTWNFMDACD